MLCVVYFTTPGLEYMFVADVFASLNKFLQISFMTIVCGLFIQKASVFGLLIFYLFL